MTTINIRIDQKTKDAAKKTFAKLGIDLTGAIKLFLHQSIEQNAIPFTPKYSLAKQKKWEKEIKEARKQNISFKNAKDMFKSMGIDTQ